MFRGALVLALLLCLPVAWAVAATGEAGDVASGTALVIDGDTLEIAGERIRLQGIDAPESAQDCTTSEGVLRRCGSEATAYLQALVVNRDLTCTRIETDRYGRTVATCTLPVGRDVGRAMVAQGYALAYVKYSRAYVADEAAARAAGAGLWTTDMEPPALYRASLYTDTDAAPAGCNLKGNISANGRIFHSPGQEWYDATRIDTGAGERWFCSPEEAVAAGWRAARR